MGEDEAVEVGIVKAKYNLVDQWVRIFSKCNQTQISFTSMPERWIHFQGTDETRILSLYS